MLTLTKWYIRSFYQYAGKDIFGNEYYTKPSKNHTYNEKRFCLYNGINETSKVPAMWHAWLHYLSRTIPKENMDLNTHIPNLTGTKLKHHPKTISPTSQKEYIPWSPAKK